LKIKAIIFYGKVSPLIGGNLLKSPETSIIANIPRKETPSA